MAPSDSTWTAPSSISSDGARDSLAADEAAGTTAPSAAPAPAARYRDGRFAGRRKVKPKLLATVGEACTGCAGTPVCQLYCPVDECMILVSDADAFPYQRIWVDPLKCVGCRKCVRQGPEGLFLDGCPWDAIAMVRTRDWEAEHGELPY